MAGDPTPPPRLAVGVIGVGRAGAPLAAALARAGHPLVAAHAVSERSRRRVEEFLPGTPPRSTAQVMEASDLVLLTVPDDVLARLVTGWPRPGRSTRASSWCTPRAGYGTGVLDPATRSGRCPWPCTR